MGNIKSRNLNKILKSSPIAAFPLPDDEKALNVAFCKDSVVVLNSSWSVSHQWSRKEATSSVFQPRLNFQIKKLSVCQEYVSTAFASAVKALESE